ncbi:MAG: hypothetical protein WD995_02040 [Gemmatimonadota bacterium]
MSPHTDLWLEILRQPDDETCGPTCLHAVYRFHGDAIPLETVVSEMTPLETGGTLGALLGSHALERGYGATLYTYNLGIFDPSWFEEEPLGLVARLREQAMVKKEPGLQAATGAYMDFLVAGGRVRFEELGPDLLREHLMVGLPIMTGLSATYLYDCPREVFEDGRSRYDSVRGSATGHFVVVHGYDPVSDSVLVADPLHDNPRFQSPSYRVGMMRLLGAIMLGALTYDANLLVLHPAAPAESGSA